MQPGGAGRPKEAARHPSYNSEEMPAPVSVSIATTVIYAYRLKRITRHRSSYPCIRYNITQRIQHLCIRNHRLTGPAAVCPGGRYDGRRYGIIPLLNRRRKQTWLTHRKTIKSNSHKGSSSLSDQRARAELASPRRKTGGPTELGAPGLPPALPGRSHLIPGALRF